VRAERSDPFDSFDPEPGDHVPQQCPKCKEQGTLMLIEYDTDEMSEGQEIDYLAGLYGTAHCRACQHEFDWRM
jgi:hypothetical protein